MGEVKQHGIDVELNADVAQGHYSNLAIISHSTSEFILDFAAMLPGLPKAQVKSRIILTPEHAKRLLMSLQENMPVTKPMLVASSSFNRKHLSASKITVRRKRGACYRNTYK